MGLARSRLAQFGPAKKRQFKLVSDRLGAPSIKKLPRGDCKEIFQCPFLFFNGPGNFRQQIPFDAGPDLVLFERNQRKPGTLLSFEKKKRSRFACWKALPPTKSVGLAIEYTLTVLNGSRLLIAKLLEPGGSVAP